jgi:hypothetical protein
MFIVQCKTASFSSVLSIKTPFFATFYAKKFCAKKNRKNRINQIHLLELDF